MTVQGEISRSAAMNLLDERIDQDKLSVGHCGLPQISQDINNRLGKYGRGGGSRTNHYVDST